MPSPPRKQKGFKGTNWEMGIGNYNGFLFLQSDEISPPCFLGERKKEVNIFSVFFGILTSKGDK